MRILLVVLLTAWATIAHADIVSEIMEPSAKVITAGGGGSATAIKYDPYIGTYLLTNWHVVRGNEDELSVQFYGHEESHKVFVHSVDAVNDLAILVTTYQHTKFAKIGKKPKLFDDVMCVGASLGHPVAPSKGIVTGVNVKMFGTRFFHRMDCNIAPGNSGGGMFTIQDGEWKLVGVPSAVVAIQQMFGSIPITFMGVSVRAVDVRQFVTRSGVLLLD